jgi:hypothetical protein
MTWRSFRPLPCYEEERKGEYADMTDFLSHLNALGQEFTYSKRDPAEVMLKAVANYRQPSSPLSGKDLEQELLAIAACWPLIPR